MDEKNAALIPKADMTRLRYPPRCSVIVDEIESSSELRTITRILLTDSTVNDLATAFVLELNAQQDPNPVNASAAIKPKIPTAPIPPS